MGKDFYEIVEYKDGELIISVKIDEGNETVWLSQKQMADLFDVTTDNISLHIKNIYKDGELDELSTTEDSSVVQNEGNRRVRRKIKIYNLDVIISVGYRVNSKKGIAFRKWSTNVLKEYMIKGYVYNEKRLRDLGMTLKVMNRVKDQLDSSQVLDVIKQYERALNLLDDYDYKRIKKPSGSEDIYILKYEECRSLIDSMRFSAESKLFGNEKDESFKGAISAIYQTYDGIEVYPSLEEKAANLLYFIVKDHCFTDGNKRIAAAIFLYFLEKNNHLIVDDKKIIDDDALVALTIMIAVLKPEEKEIMINLIMQFIK